MLNKSENLKDKQLEISLNNLELINENIRLYQDNIKLNYEVKRLKKRLKDQEDIDTGGFETPMAKDDGASVVILMVKKRREFKN